MDRASGPSPESAQDAIASIIETDDVCRCGAPRSMKNVERCMRGHPMRGTVMNPNARGSANQTRVEGLEAQFTDDYKPQTHRLKMEVHRLASLWEQRERIERNERGAGGIEHQRLDGIINALVLSLEASRPAANGTSGPQVVFFFPAKDDLEVRAAIEHEQREREARPGIAEPSRDSTVGAAIPAAVAPGERLIDSYLVPERHRTDTESRVVLRPIREDEVIECMSLQGDAENYKRGLIDHVTAYRATRAWLKSKGGFA